MAGSEVQAPRQYGVVGGAGYFKRAVAVFQLPTYRRVPHTTASRRLAHKMPASDTSRAALQQPQTLGRRWENSLIGWTSSADSLEQAAEQHLYFKSLESAMAFCHRQGWAYDVAGEKAISKQRPKRFLGYGDNFRRAEPRVAGQA